MVLPDNSVYKYDPCILLFLQVVRMIHGYDSRSIDSNGARLGSVVCKLYRNTRISSMFRLWGYKWLS